VPETVSAIVPIGEDVEGLRRHVEQRIHDEHQRQKRADDTPVAEYAPPIERQPADELVVLSFLEKLRERGFHEGRRHAEERGDPHPEQRARPADGNRPRDADNVARSRAHRQAEHERRERADARILRLPAQHDPHDPADVHRLDEACADREVDADADQQENRERELPEHGNLRPGFEVGGKVPEEVRDGCNEGKECVHGLEKIFHAAFLSGVDLS
jgi:hypothetical protein